MTPRAARLWTADPDRLDEDDLRRLAAGLDAAENARAQRFLSERARRQFVAAHALARRALATVAGGDPAAWSFVAGPHGRPELVAGPPGLRFNISHTDGLVACLVGHDAEIGVDVEATDRTGQLVDVAERYFSRAEAAELRGLAATEQRGRFLQYWTLKESYIKARGLGLALPLGQFTFLIGEPIGISIEPELGDDAARWQFTLQGHGRRHLVATAIAPLAPGPVAIERHDGDAVLSG